MMMGRFGDRGTRFQKVQLSGSDQERESMILDFIHTIVQGFSLWVFDLGFPLPCWDIVAESFGVCR